jgi:prevent-host-death family protein
MSSRRVSAARARVRFGELLREIERTGGPVSIDRHGREVAVIVSAAVYRRRPTTTRRPSTVSDPAEAAFGMWAGRRVLDSAWLTEGRSRWRSRWRRG